jgi:hypothetical protein
LIYSASAFHWIPEELGYRKVFRELKRGGVFARFANNPFEDKANPALCDAIQASYQRYLPNAPKPTEYNEEMARNRAEIARAYGFEDIQWKVYKRIRRFTPKEYGRLLSTYSDHRALGEQRLCALIDEIEDAITRHGGFIDIYDTIDLQVARKK